LPIQNIQQQQLLLLLRRRPRRRGEEDGRRGIIGWMQKINVKSSTANTIVEKRRKKTTHS